MPENLATNPWSIAVIPPRDSPDVGKFFWELFLDSRTDKEDRHLPERWRDNYKLCRGKHWRSNKPEHQRYQLTVNLMSYYREKNVISLCSRNPVAEVKTINGVSVPAELEENDDQSSGKSLTNDMIMNCKVQSWWSETDLQTTLRRAVHINETYGTMFERFVPMLQKIGIDGGQSIYRCLPPVFEPGDPFGHFTPPGNFGQPSDGSYHVVASIWDVAAAKAFYGNDNIKPEEELAKELLALDRKNDTPPVRNTIADSGGFDNDWGPSGRGTERAGGKYRPEKCLVLECWIKDRKTGPHKEMFEETNALGESILVEREVDGPLYPGNIRMVAITNHGDLVLRDLANPNVNMALPRSQTKNTWLFNTFPFHKMVSYLDEQSPYGFALCEQIGPINLRIDEILAKLVQGIMFQANPILVLPKGSGIDAKQITTRPGDIIQPPPGSQPGSIYYLEHPGIGNDGKWLLNALMGLCDQLASHQEVDRGEVPGGVIAASAIEALQEQNRTMRENKIHETDSLVAWRGKCMISYLQNFHWEKETLLVQDVPVPFVGMDHAGCQYQYTVQKGSTYIQSASQKFKDSIELFKSGAIDTLQLLRDAGRADADEIFARMYGAPLSAAIQSMLDAHVITPQDAALIRGKLEAIKAGQTPEHSGMEAPLPGLQANAAGGAQPKLMPVNKASNQGGGV